MIADWHDPEIAQRDNWRRELAEAAPFAPALGGRAARRRAARLRAALRQAPLWALVKPADEAPRRRRCRSRARRRLESRRALAPRAAIVPATSPARPRGPSDGRRRRASRRRRATPRRRSAASCRRSTKAANLPALLTALSDAAAPRTSTRWEIIVVDDGSSDDTALAIAPWLRGGGVRYVALSRNFGKEAALTAGLDRARGDVVLLMDADLQHPPALIGEHARTPGAPAPTWSTRCARRAATSRG